MTDTERERINAICEVAGVAEIDDLSDGFHAFRQLYYQRMMLFATIVKQNKKKAWKSLRHEDGELCFGGGWFVVGIDTPEGSYTYHYENKYFDLFDCEILDYGKHWDGHTEKDVTRLLSLPKTQLSQEGTTKDATSDLISRQAAIDLADKVEDMWLKGEIDSIYAPIVKGLNALPSAQPEQRWIPCSERMPDVAQRVLLSGHGMVMVGMLHGFSKYSLEPTGMSYIYPKDSIEAWTPLPEPYEGGSTDE